MAEPVRSTTTRKAVSASGSFCSALKSSSKGSSSWPSTSLIHSSLLAPLCHVEDVHGTEKAQVALRARCFLGIWHADVAAQFLGLRQQPLPVAAIVRALTLGT